MNWFFCLILILFYLFFKSIIAYALKIICQYYFTNYHYVQGDSSFSIKEFQAENNLLSIKIIGFQLNFCFSAIFDLTPKPFFQISFDYLLVCFKSNLHQLHRHTKRETRISVLTWLLQKSFILFILCLIRKFFLSIRAFIIEFKQYEIQFQIQQLDNLFKYTHHSLFSDLYMRELSLSYQNHHRICIPEILLKFNLNINFLKYIVLYGFDMLGLSIDLIKVQILNSQSIIITFENASISLLSFPHTHNTIIMKPIKLMQSYLFMDFPPLEFSVSNIFCDSSQLSCSGISILNEDKTIAHAQNVSYRSKKIHIASATFHIYYFFLTNITSILQIFYKNEPKLPKQLNLPFSLVCSHVLFKFTLSDKQKIKIQLFNGFELKGTNQLIHLNHENDDIELHSTIISIDKGSCWIFQHELNSYFDFMTISKTEIELLNTKVLTISAQTFNVYVSPVFLFVTYFKLFGKCMSHLVSIIKGPLFKQFEHYPPTLIKLTFHVKTLNIFVMKNILASQIQISNDAKKMSNDEMQLRFQRFYSILVSMNQKNINKEAIEESGKQLRFNLFRESLRKIRKHNNSHEVFAQFAMSEVFVDIDGFYFQSKRNIIDNFLKNDKFAQFHLTEEKIGRTNSMKLIIEMESVAILSNINTQFPQYKICTMKTPRFECEFHIMEKKVRNNHDYFINHMTSRNESFELPMLTSEPLLIYDNMKFIIDHVSVDIMPSFLSYYTDSILILSQVFKKQIPYPKYTIFDNLRLKNLIFGSLVFNKLKFNLVIKPSSPFMSMRVYHWQINFFNPLSYATSFTKSSISIENKGLFLSCPPFHMDVNLKSTNEYRENEVYDFPFTDVDSAKILDFDYDPYQWNRSHQIDLTIGCTFPILSNNDSMKHSSSNSSITLNFDYLNDIIDTFFIKHKFTLEKVNHLFMKSVKKRNPVSMHFHVLPFDLPTINIAFMNHIIKILLAKCFFENDVNKTIFSLDTIEIWFIKMKDMNIGRLFMTKFISKFFPGMRNFELKEFNFELYDKYLINFFVIVASTLPITNAPQKMNSSLSFATKKEESTWKQRIQSSQNRNMVNIDPRISLKQLLDIYNTTFMYVKLNRATLRFFHRKFIIFPSVSFINLSVESRASTSRQNGRLDIFKFEEFLAELIPKEGFPFLLINELEVNIMSRKDRLLLQMMLRNGMKMNFQSEAITLATSNLFSNLPKLEQLFNDDLIHKIRKKRQEKKADKKRNLQIRMRPESEISSLTKQSSDSYIQLNDDADLVVVNVVSDKQNTQLSLENCVPDGMLTFISRLFVSIQSTVCINLIDSNFRTISTLNLEDITYDYLNDIDGIIHQSIVISNFTMLNKLPSARDQNGNPNRYYKFVSPLDSVTSDNPFFTMNIHQISHMMKMPFFNRIQIALLPVELNISKDFIDELVSNFKLFAEYNVFDFDKMLRDIKTRNQQQEEIENDEDKTPTATNFSPSDRQSNPYGFYGKVEIEKLKLRMSLFWESAALLKTFENRGLYIEPIVETDIIGTKETIIKLLKKKIYLAIWRSLPSLLASDKNK